MNKQIKYVKGNVVDALLNNEIDYLIHQVNCKGVMNSGIAKEIRQRIPEAYEGYLKHYNDKSLTDAPLLGTKCLGGNVINMFSQEYYGYDGKRYTNYGAIASVFHNLVSYSFCCEIHRNIEDVVLGLPFKMGCDRGGAEWQIVEELIQFLLVPYFKEVRVYEL